MVNESAQIPRVEFLTYALIPRTARDTKPGANVRPYGDVTTTTRGKTYEIRNRMAIGSPHITSRRRVSD